MLVAGAWAVFSWGLIVAALLVDGSVAARIFIAAVLVPIGILSTRIAVRAPKASVTVGGDGVEVVGLLRSRHVPLDEVDRFVVEANASFGQSCVALARRRGRRYLLWATGRGVASVATARTRERLAQVCDELNGALAEARAAPPA